MAEVLQQALYLVVLVSAPAVLASLLVGLLVGVVQAATQLQDQTLSFVPKLLAVFAVLVLTAPWLGAQLLRFAGSILSASATFD